MFVTMLSRDLWCADLHLLSAPGPGRPPVLLCVWWLCASVAIYSIQLCEREYPRVSYCIVPRPVVCRFASAVRSRAGQTTRVALCVVAVCISSYIQHTAVREYSRVSYYVVPRPVVCRFTSAVRSRAGQTTRVALCVVAVCISSYIQHTAV